MNTLIRRVVVASSMVIAFACLSQSVQAADVTLTLVSEAPGELKGSGTYTAPVNATEINVQFWYRQSGTTTWTKPNATMVPSNSTWEKLITGLPGGVTYEAKAVLTWRISDTEEGTESEVKEQTIQNNSGGGGDG